MLYNGGYRKKNTKLLGEKYLKIIYVELHLQVINLT